MTKYLRYKPGSSASLKPISAGLPRVYDHYLEDKTYMYQLGDPRNRFERPPVEPNVPPFLGGPPIDVKQITLPPVASYPGLKSFAQQAEIAQRKAAVQAAETEVAQVTQGLPELRASLRTAETALTEARLKIKTAMKDNDNKTSVVTRKTAAIGHWRFEGSDTEAGFLADSSGQGHTLSRVTAGDPPATLFPAGQVETGHPVFQSHTRRAPAQSAGSPIPANGELRLPGDRCHPGLSCRSLHD